MRSLILIAAAAAALTGGVAAQVPGPDLIIKAWDKNGDGAVSREEWTAAGRPADRFDLVDTNKDGKVTLQELTAAINTQRQRQGGQ